MEYGGHCEKKRHTDNNVPRALLIGYAGFVGSHLVTGCWTWEIGVSASIVYRLLFTGAEACEYRSSCSADESMPAEDDPVKMHIFSSVDFVFHLAARPGVRARRTRILKFV
jgi:nucleoside-diphosphate-sugar epimerase